MIVLASLLISASVAAASIPPIEVDGPWLMGVEHPFVPAISSEAISELVTRIEVDEALANELKEIVQRYHEALRAFENEVAPMLRARDEAIDKADEGSIARARELAAREADLAPVADRERALLHEAEASIAAALPLTAVPVWESMRAARLAQQMRLCMQYYLEEMVDWTRLLSCGDETPPSTWRLVSCEAWPSIASARLKPMQEVLDHWISRARRMQRDRLATLVVVDDKVVISPSGRAALDQVRQAKQQHDAHRGWRDAQIETLKSLEALLSPDDAALLRLHFWIAALEGKDRGGRGRAAALAWADANRTLGDEGISPEHQELVTAAMASFVQQFSAAAGSFARALEPIVRQEMGVEIATKEHLARAEQAATRIDSAVDALAKALQPTPSP